MAPLINGKGAGGRKSDDWDPKWKGELASAACRGQWTQVRRAMVPEWNIDDKLCQLCFEAVGTEQHRFECRCTTPEEGWPLPPDKAMPAVRNLSALRLRVLQTRGLLVLRIPVQRPKQEGSFIWLLEPNFQRADIDQAVWYFDGSLLNGRWMPLRATGFGIAIVARDGKLLACGRGSPPHWCAMAAAAEAWALQFVLSLQPFPPSMRTDCQSLLTTMQDTPQHATAASKQLARIWVAVADMLGGCFKAFHEAEQLVWMPAHTTSSVGEV